MEQTTDGTTSYRRSVPKSQGSKGSGPASRGGGASLKVNVCRVDVMVTEVCTSKKKHQWQDLRRGTERAATVEQIRAVLLTCLRFSVNVIRDRCDICVGPDDVLCNPGHLLHLGKLFPPTRLSVGSSHSRLPKSFSSA
ncbi:hypothetical protein Baya_4691 [Bagarius yarrelli]|uniref:Uncharacterized protein n=1 Tax=Bagarius yarrelli TaxID=175774 RepID=A0A556TTD5_BAGYA|nr:hypothetical protein Baya_4691 [Bagarius yarrelli]